MVPKPTSSHNHNHVLGFPGLGFPPPFPLCWEELFFFPFHLTDPEDSLPSGHIATKIIFQYQIFSRTTLRHNSCGSVLWGDVLLTQRSSFTRGLHRTQINTVPTPPVPRGLWNLCNFYSHSWNSKTALQTSISD